MTMSREEAGRKGGEASKGSQTQSTQNRGQNAGNDTARTTSNEQHKSSGGQNRSHESLSEAGRKGGEASHGGGRKREADQD